MTKTKRNAPSLNDAGVAISKAPIHPSKTTPKAGNSKKTKVTPTEADAAILSPSDVKPQRAPRDTKTSKSETKDKTAVTAKSDATGSEKSADAQNQHRQNSASHSSDCY